MMVTERLVQFVEREQLLAEEQGRFRRKREFGDQILTLTLLGQMKMVSRNRGMLVAYTYIFIFVRLIIMIYSENGSKLC